MKTLILLAGIYFFSLTAAAQQPFSGEEVVVLNNAAKDENVNENYLSSLAEEIENLRSSPIDLNSADEEMMAETGIFEKKRIYSLILYRSQCGEFIDLYELQAVPGWDISFISMIRPFVTVKSKVTIGKLIDVNKTGRSSTLLIRSRFFSVIDSSCQIGFAFKFNHTFGKYLNVGISGENDPGEKFCFTKSQKGFDFLSGYASYQGSGVLKKLILGDYVVNLGQGLIHWQSASFVSGSAADGILREGPLTKPYSSFGEFNYHRGVSCLFSKNKLSLLAFLSSKNLDSYRYRVNFGADTMAVSSFDYSGLHATPSELSRKSNCHELLGGFSMGYKSATFGLSCNVIETSYSLPVVPDSSLPYARFYFRGRLLNNLSLAYFKTKNNFHFFGETATDFCHFSTVNGVLISLAENASVSLLHRFYSKGFAGFYADPFSDHGKSANEKGLAVTFSCKLSSRAQLKFFLNRSSYNWLTYGVDFPSGTVTASGTYQFVPSKKSRYSVSWFWEKDRHYFFNDSSFSLTGGTFSKKLRLEADFLLNETCRVRTRLDYLILRHDGTKEEGTLLSMDLKHRWKRIPMSLTCRLLLFDTPGYNSRLFLLDNDITYSYTIGCYYGTGAGGSVIGTIGLTRKIKMECKFQRVCFVEQSVTSKWDVKLQLRAFF